MRDLDWPPSTLTEAPVSRLACSEARNTATAAISSTLPNLPEGISRFTNCAIPSGSCSTRRAQPPPGNRMEPGHKLFTVIPWAATCSASVLEKLMSEALAAL